MYVCVYESVTGMCVCVFENVIFRESVFALIPWDDLESPKFLAELTLHTNALPTNEQKAIQTKKEKFNFIKFIPVFHSIVFLDVRWWISAGSRVQNFNLTFLSPRQVKQNANWVGKLFSFFLQKMLVFPLGVCLEGFSIDSTFRAIKFFLLKKRVTKCSGEKQ